MAYQASSETVFLQGPEDWEVWNIQFKSKAISTKIWKLISPKEREGGQSEIDPFAEEPTKPKFEDYDKKLTRETRSTSSSTATATAQNQLSTFEEVDHVGKPKSTAEITIAAR